MATLELSQAVVDDEATEAAEETTAEENLRKEKKNVAPSAQQVANPFEDVYLIIFHTGAPFEILGNTTQLAAWWRMR